MIYATTKTNYSTTFAFDTKFQEKVERAMNSMGWGDSNYYLSKTKPRWAIRIKILDKWGYKFEVKNS